MVGVVLTGHGKFALGLGDAIQMVTGDHEHFACVPFEADKAASYEDDLRAAIKNLYQETEAVLVFVDLLGGTPFNKSMLISAEYENLEVVTGTNLPMLIECLMTSDDASCTLQDLVQTALDSGKEGIVHKELPVPSAKQESSDCEDGI